MRLGRRGKIRGEDGEEVVDGEGEMKRLNNKGPLHVVLAAGHTGLQPLSPTHVAPHA